MVEEPKQGHWDAIYRTKADNEVSWYQPHLAQSIDLILQTGVDSNARIIDIGGGASTFVDDLLDRGFRNITVVDISGAALDIAKQRLGARSGLVSWRVGDITTLDFPADAFDLWHDRAVFHFLTNESDRKQYIERVCCSVKKDGFVIVATFGPEGPEKCSGLPVARYSSAELHRRIRRDVPTARSPRGASPDAVGSGAGIRLLPVRETAGVLNPASTKS